MNSLKFIKWLAIAIITPWLIFMLISAFKGGEPFKEMGASIVAVVQDITLKLSKKADMIQIQADEWKEKLTGVKGEEKAAEEAKSKDEKAPVKKTKVTTKRPPAAQQPSSKTGDAQ
jgi:hypothetical protein